MYSTARLIKPTIRTHMKETKLVYVNLIIDFFKQLNSS